MFASLADENAHNLAQHIDDTGYAVVENYFSDEALAAIGAKVEANIDDSWNVLASPRSTAEDEGFLDRWKKAPEFLALCNSLACESYANEFHPKTKQTLRVLHGQSSSIHSRQFHYDSYLVTAILPLVAPKETGSCDLYLIPNSRPHRKWYISNVFDKLWVDSPVMQRHLKRKLLQSRLTKVEMVPGNLYFFWGYRSLHASERFEQSGIRCTAVIHYGLYHSQQLEKLRQAATKDGDGEAASDH
jgi:ectoine hydroxylase-related dioxygenase (phytanoyl-CoA dioxygenase family)